MTSRRSILLYSRLPEHVERWEAWLAGIGLDTLPIRRLLTMNMAQVPTLPDIALVLTDEPVDLMQVGISRCRLARGEIGVITVGCAIPADVNLPADATAGEIQLACRLLAQIVALRADLAQQREAQTTLRDLAETDPLTKLANRRAWDAKLESLAIGGNAEASGDLVIAILDIDGFKQFNDQQGHAAADEQLAEIARRLTGAVRRNDFLARWGGDEFALVLADLPAENAFAVVERIRQAAAPHGAEQLTLSAGWARVDEKAGCPETSEAFQTADAALREAKQAGGDQTREGRGNKGEPAKAIAG
jgi:diguanylate cyclase (GGDEF)-like protein